MYIYEAVLLLMHYNDMLLIDHCQELSTILRETLKF